VTNSDNTDHVPNGTYDHYTATVNGSTVDLYVAHAVTQATGS
jgi:hypothetical protein